MIGSRTLISDEQRTKEEWLESIRLYLLMRAEPHDEDHDDEDEDDNSGSNNTSDDEETSSDPSFAPILPHHPIDPEWFEADPLMIGMLLSDRLNGDRAFGIFRGLLQTGHLLPTDKVELWRLLRSLITIAMAVETGLIVGAVRQQLERQMDLHIIFYRIHAASRVALLDGNLRGQYTALLALATSITTDLMDYHACTDPHKSIDPEWMVTLVAMEMDAFEDLTQLPYPKGSFHPKGSSSFLPSTTTTTTTTTKNPFIEYEWLVHQKSMAMISKLLIF